MGYSTIRLTSIFLALAAIVSGTQALADDFSFDGSVRQGVSLATDTASGSNPSLGPTQYTIEGRATYRPTDTLKFTADLWLRGDWFYKLNGGHVQEGGIQDFTAGPPFLDQFRYNLSRGGNGTLPQPFGNKGNKQTALTDFNDDVIRDMSVSYADPAGAYVLSAGKFQRGWGQADGLRLLDVLYPMDLRQRFVFTDTEDLRLPAWSVALDADLVASGLSAPFDALGMNNSSVELIFIPEARHNEFVVNNPTPSDSTNGGIFGFPYPLLVDGSTGWGLPFIGTNLKDKEVNGIAKQFAARLKFDALGGEATLNGFYGHQEMPILVLTGSQLIIGNALNNPSAPGAIAVPLDQATTIGAFHGPGGYLDFLSALKAGTAAPGDFPLIPFGCNDILVSAPNCSINANFNLDYTYRKKLLGFSFTRDLSEIKLGPKSVSPVLRLEATYEFNKPFNKGVVTTPFATTASGTSALITTVDAGVAFRNVSSFLVGFDYNLWLPFWKSQESSIFLTSQFFDIHTNNPENLLAQAPYAFDFVKKDQKYFTQTWTLPIMNQSVVLDGLFIWDASKHGYAYRQRIDFSMMGGQLKPRIELGYFDGKSQAGLLGYMKNADYLEFSVAYQF